MILVKWTRLHSHTYTYTYISYLMTNNSWNQCCLPNRTYSYSMATECCDLHLGLQELPNASEFAVIKYKCIDDELFFLTLFSISLLIQHLVHFSFTSPPQPPPSPPSPISLHEMRMWEKKNFSSHLTNAIFNFIHSTFHVVVLFSVLIPYQFSTLAFTIWQKVHKRMVLDKLWHWFSFFMLKWHEI